MIIYLRQGARGSSLWDLYQKACTYKYSQETEEVMELVFTWRTANEIHIHPQITERISNSEEIQLLKQRGSSC